MWPFRKRQKRLPIPEYEAEHRYEPIHVKPPPKVEQGIEVQEHDATDVDIKELQSRTGVQRVFDRLTGKFK